MREEQGPITVLVAVASRHGATRGIGEIVGEQLQMRGIDAVVQDVDDVQSLVGYDAVGAGTIPFASSATLWRWLVETGGPVGVRTPPSDARPWRAALDWPGFAFDHLLDPAEPGHREGETDRRQGE